MTAVKFRAGKFMVKGTLTPNHDNGTITVGFPFNKTLLAEIKSFEGARWNPEKKKWSIKDSPRNHFQLQYLMGENPYARYDLPLINFVSNRQLYNHQGDLAAHGLTRKCGIWAAEMGTGKSLSAIEVMEASGEKDWWWIAPKSALRSVQLEFSKWKSKVMPRIMTYEGLVKELKNWTPGKKAPKGVIFDEASKLRNPTAQRSQAAMELANGIRKDHDGFVILMTGTPAPKNPADWWFLCEIACPGFLKEGTYEKCKQRLGVVEMKESIQGGVYPQLVTWKDDENKCVTCGQLPSAPCHDPIAIVTGEHGEYHAYAKSVNEILNLYERMSGLVVVKLKKHCLDLPEKRYEIIRVEPTPSVLRAASLIQAKCSTVIQAMTLMRELSDGFQYSEERSGTRPCSLCKGKKVITAPLVDRAIEVTEENLSELSKRYPNGDLEIGDMFVLPDAIAEYTEEVSTELVTCPNCEGDGTVETFKRTVETVPCPKDDIVKDFLDQFDDVGRTVFFGGFSGSVDRLQTICLSQEWEVIRVDGRGWEASWGKVDELDMLRLFQETSNTKAPPRIAFVGQPSAAGMGLTLTASPMECFFSNDFNGESRWQAEDRIHRPGMDVNRGATIYDIVHLPTDEVVLNNLQKKKTLQSLSMGDLQSVLASATGRKL